MPYLCLSKRLEMQLPQHIIDLVGNLFDEGMDDETICRAVIKAWEKHMESPRRNAFGNDDPAGDSINIQVDLEDTTRGIIAPILETDWYRSR